MQDLTGRTAVITGGASGMGRAFADRFAAAGMRLVLADIEEPALDQAVTELADAGAEVIGVRTDVALLEDNEALRDRTLDAFGQANVICLNAGVGGGGVMSELTALDWQWTLGVNLNGVVYGLTSFLPHLESHGDGHVVITSSIAGHTCHAGMGPYNASKHAVAAIAETLHHEFQQADSSLGVTCLCPGFVSTRIIESERNRPETLTNPGVVEERTEEEEMTRAMVLDFFANAKPASEVADLVHDAVVEQRFWLFTDEQFVDNIAVRHQAIQTASNPAPLGTLADQLD